MTTLLGLPSSFKPGPDNDVLFLFWALFQVPAVKFVLLVAAVAVGGTLLVHWLDPTGERVRRNLARGGAVWK